MPGEKPIDYYERYQRVSDQLADQVRIKEHWQTEHGAEKERRMDLERRLDVAIEREVAATDRANVAEARVREIEEANRWRKVSEEMPEEFRDLLVGWTSNRKVCKAWQFEGEFQEDAHNDGVFKKQPTHWRPLPAPPKED